MAGKNYHRDGKGYSEADPKFGKNYRVSMYEVCLLICIEECTNMAQNPKDGFTLFVAFFLLERKGVNDDNGRLRFLCWFREQKTRFSLFEMCSKIAHRLTRGNSSYETEG